MGEVPNALWKSDNDASIKTTTKYTPVIDDKISYISVKKDDNSPEIRIDIGIEQNFTSPTVTNTVVSLVPDVIQLTAEEDQNMAKSKFTTAITAINKKNSALYKTISNSSLNVKVYIVPQDDIENPNMAGQTTRPITLTPNMYNLLSADVFDFEGESKPVSLTQLTGGTYKNRVIKNAKLVTGLFADERKNIQLASEKKDVNILRTDIRNKIKEYDLLLETEIITQVQNGTVNEVFLNTLKYEVTSADLYKYCKLGTKFDIYLNYGHAMINGSQTDFNKVLAHEFKHIDYAINNFYDVIKWNFIREASCKNKVTLFDLKDKEGDNGSCGCSAEEGHEKIIKN